GRRRRARAAPRPRALAPPASPAVELLPLVADGDRADADLADRRGAPDGGERARRRRDRDARSQAADAGDGRTGGGRAPAPARLVALAGGAPHGEGARAL